MAAHSAALDAALQPSTVFFVHYNSFASLPGVKGCEGAYREACKTLKNEVVQNTYKTDLFPSE